MNPVEEPERDDEVAEKKKKKRAKVESFFGSGFETCAHSLSIQKVCDALTAAQSTGSGFGNLPGGGGGCEVWVEHNSKRC